MRLRGGALDVAYRLVRAVAESSDVSGGAPRLLQTIAESFGWQQGVLWLLDEDGTLRWAAGWSSDSPRIRRFAEESRAFRFAAGEGLPGRVLTSGRAAWITDVRTDANFPRRPLAEEAGLHAAVGVPVLSGPSLVGVMEFFAEEIREPDDETLQVIEGFGAQVGQAIEGWRAEERLRRSEAVKGAVLSAALDCVAVMDARGRVVEFNPAAEETFGYAREEALGCELAELLVPPELRDEHRAGLRRYLETGDSKILDRRLMMTAMRADGSRFPVELTVTVLPGQHPPLFAGFVRDISKLQEAATEQLRLMDRQREARIRAEQTELQARRLAQTLQTSLLPPRLPVIPGFEIAARFRAGTEALMVGGDFYDVFETHNGWRCVIGDVCGKGAEAAAVTGLARYTLRAAAMREPSPAATLALLNEALRAEAGAQLQLCSAICLSLAPNEHEQRVAVAGHPAPIVIRGSGSVEHLPASGTMLGAMDAPALSDQSFRLEADETLLLYTDGLTEARANGELLGSERLAATLGDLDGRADPQALLSGLLDRIFGDLGYHAADDVAVLALSRRRG